MEKFDNGVITTFNQKSLENIADTKVSLILINLKEDIISEHDQILLNFVPKHLKNDGNIFIINTNLKSFTTTKECIEKYDYLKFQEVITFKSGHNLVDTQYCSRYIFKNNQVENIFNMDKDFGFLRISLFNHIMENIIAKNEMALSLFEQSNFLSKIDNNFSPQWICFKKRRGLETKNAIKYLKEQLLKQQISLLDTENQSIG